MDNIGATIKFKDICVMFERIKKSSLPAKEKYLRRYYESFLKHRQSFRKEKNINDSDEETGGSSFYCILRCIIPGADSARIPYGMQVTSLGKIYIKVLQLPQDSREVQKLQARSYSGIQGDYADIVYSVLLPRVQKEPSNLSLKEIHDMLDTIAEDDRRNTEKVLTALVEKSSAEEQKWFIRLLLKSMHIGIGEQKVLATLHPQAKELYQRCSNLLRVCCLLADDKLTLSVKEESAAPSNSLLNLNAAIVPFQHIRPMLCEIFPGDITPLMASDLLYMETKMDGERFQLHFENNRFKYISRNGKDYTAGFGENFENGNLTPHLRNILPIGVRSLIIDGEMMVWDERQKKFRDKGENTDVKHLTSSGDSNWRPCFVAYDLLFLDGQSMLDLPYIQRVYKLGCLLNQKPGVLQIMKPLKVESLEDFKRLFQKALDDNQEGVVLKKQNSLYRPGVRNGGGWYKIKADYIEGLTHEFDLIVMGGFYNRQRTWVESFLLGVLTCDDTGRIDVYSVGRVTNNPSQRFVFVDKLKTHWRNLAVDPAPLWYHYSEKNPDGRPDLWIEPRHSIILQVRAADLTNSIAYALPKSLHFPRIVRQRKDKEWSDCLTLDEFKQLYQGSGRSLKKINKRELKEEDFTTHRKRRKLTVTEKRKLGMMSYEKKLNSEKIEKSSNFLAGYEICVLSASLREGVTPEEVKAMVVSHGGEIVENPIYTNPKCISIAGDLTFRVERLCKVCRTNIVSIHWLLRSCAAEEIQSLQPRDMVCTTESLRKKFSENFDEYGDSYEDCFDLDDFKEILDGISNEQISSFEFSPSDVEKLEEKLKIQSYFRSLKADSYFYGTSTRLELAKILFEWHNGRYITDLGSDNIQNVQYIFIDIATFDKDFFKTWLSNDLNEILKNIKVVNMDWIIHSHQAKRKLDVCEYTWLDF